MYVCAHWWGVGGIGKRVCSIKDVRLEVGDWQSFSKNILLCVTMANGKPDTESIVWSSSNM